MPDHQDLVGVLVEGETDVPAVDSLLSSCGLARDAARTIVAIGKDQLDSRIASVNRNARRQRWFVLRDLDRDGGRCAPVLRRSLLTPERQESALVLRVAVTSPSNRGCSRTARRSQITSRCLCPRFQGAQTTSTTPRSP